MFVCMYVRVCCNIVSKLISPTYHKYICKSHIRLDVTLNRLCTLKYISYPRKIQYFYIYFETS